ncbi:MAG: putative tricarboxylic transport rane protein [Clostridia bacterium]|nr:putative tricarboxylic transport rane protein [Clostridia bacterium]
MFDLQAILQGFTINLMYIWIIVIGVIFGIFIGIIPGFSTSNTLMVLLPLTLAMKIEPALIFMAAVYCGANMGGSVPAILINAPGEGGAVATTIDGYQMAVQGKGQQALVISNFSSAIGGIIGCAVALFATPSLAHLALRFGSVEMFVIVLFGLVLIAQIAANNLAKGLLAGFFGLLMGAIGFDHMWDIPRATFGLLEFYDGMPRIPAMIGLFAVSEALVMLEKTTIATAAQKMILGRQAFWEGIKETLAKWKLLLISSLTGLIIGAIPGTGASIAGFVSYQYAKSFSKNPDKFGKGAPEGVLAPEAANNSVTGGALVPTLTLGIPGSGSTLVMLIVMQAHGLPIGPRLFQAAPVTAYAVIIGLLLAHVLLIFIGLPICYRMAKLTQVPTVILAPIMMALVLTAAFAERKYFFDIILALFFGLLGYVMRKTNYPLHSLILGIILGPMAEDYFVRSMRLGSGSLLVFFSTPLVQVLWVLLIIVAVGPGLYRMLTKNKTIAVKG